MNGLLLLFIEFFKIGLFSVGGGMATLPFLYRLADKYTWFSVNQIPDMIAISESTPGPLGVNMATYTGFQFGGALGSVCATLGLIFPSVVIIVIISKFLEKFFYDPDPEFSTALYEAMVDNPSNYLAVTGLIASAGAGVLIGALFHSATLDELEFSTLGSMIGIKECILFAVLLFATNKWKKHPVFYIAIGAVIGIVLGF